MLFYAAVRHFWAYCSLFYPSGVLAILNSNCELTLWGPSQNRVTGEWTTVGRRPRSATNSDID